MVTVEAVWGGEQAARWTSMVQVMENRNFFIIVLLKGEQIDFESGQGCRLCLLYSSENSHFSSSVCEGRSTAAEGTTEVLKPKGQ